MKIIHTVIRKNRKLITKKKYNKYLLLNKCSNKINCKKNISRVLAPNPVCHTHKNTMYHIYIAIMSVEIVHVNNTRKRARARQSQADIMPKKCAPKEV